jgi:hypothetical protein
MKIIYINNPTINIISTNFLKDKVMQIIFEKI